MRSRTSSGGPACLNSSLGFSGSRSPNAHWPSLRVFAGRAVVIWAVLLLEVASVRTRKTPVGFRRRRSVGQLGVQVGGSTASRQTATAADALEIDVPTRHQRNALAGLGGGH